MNPMMERVISAGQSPADGIFQCPFCLEHTRSCYENLLTHIRQLHDEAFGSDRSSSTRSSQSVQLLAPSQGSDTFTVSDTPLWVRPSATEERIEDEVKTIFVCPYCEQVEFTRNAQICHIDTECPATPRSPRENSPLAIVSDELFGPRFSRTAQGNDTASALFAALQRLGNTAFQRAVSGPAAPLTTTGPRSTAAGHQSHNSSCPE